MSSDVVVDLISDTVTRPSTGMRDLMARAPVGDEQRGEDPTVNLLQERVAELLGKDDALFVPSGTMCNAISFMVLCNRGDEIIMDATAHGWNAEAGGPAVLAGALVRPVEGRGGIFSADQVRAATRSPARQAPRTAAVLVEQTSNRGGGTCWTLGDVAGVCAVADERGLSKLMDGARLLNAAVATGTSAREFARFFDSAWIDLSKGLGAPVGAVLAGSSGYIDEARRAKQLLGGAMRQSGVIAAAGLYALHNNVERLAEDHARAQRLGNGLAELRGIEIEPQDVQTNILFFEVSTLSAPDFASRILDEHGVRMGAVGETQVRAVTHLDVDDDGIERALAAAREVLEA